MRADSEGHRQQLLDGLRRFVASVRQIAGVRRIAILGSIVTAKPDPKDIDVLVVVADDADLAQVATCSRRFQGHAQSLNRGADVFLADERDTYIGRTCRWKDCRPGVRRSCDALHCGRGTNAEHPIARFYVDRVEQANLLKPNDMFEVPTREVTTYEGH